MEFGRRYAPVIAGFAGNLDIPRQDADDVLQETNVVLWQKREDFTEGTNFWAWACRIAQFQVLSLRKQQQRDRLRFDDDLIEQLATESVEMPSDRQEALEKCLDGLSDRKRELISLRYGTDLPAAKVAEKLGLTRGAVYDSLYNIRLSLAHCIDHFLIDEGEDS